MNGVFIVPTGIGAEIGGHSGDATPAAKLVASLCDKLFIHPNVVNASDLNDMTENMLYVEGSILDRFLGGQIGLKEVYQNKVLLAVNNVTPEIVNAVSAARATMGADIQMIKLRTPLIMESAVKDGKATGFIFNFQEAIQQVSQYKFDVLVVNTPIRTNDDMVREYLTTEGGLNLWGGVEAKLSRIMSEALDRPVFHAPVENSEVFKTFNEIVDTRKAAEMVSVCYLHCCLKGAHVAPKITQRMDKGYWSTDIDFLVTPINVVGPPHRACLKAGIPVIAVEENKTVLNDPMPSDFIIAKNYLEATGIIAAKKAGIVLASVKRPLERTIVNE